MNWITPKTNFIAEDYYNYSDLNRVENNTNYLRDYLIYLGYRVPLLDIKTNRDNTNIDFLSSINKIENNIEIIKNIFAVPPGYEGKKTWILGQGFSYLDANRLENNLEKLKDYAEKTEEGFIYCGTIYCGQGGLL